MSALRVGIVGPSWFAENVHLAGLESHPRAQLTAVCGRHRANAEALAARHGDPVVFDDYRAMFGSELVDAVVIVVPDDLHHEFTLAALEAGLHVLCEKPLACSAQDAREMLDAAAAANVVHMIMMTWRWMPIPAYAKRLIADGYLGRVRRAHFSMQSEYDAETINSWRFDPAAGTATILVEYAKGATGTIDVSGTRMPGDGIEVDVRLYGDDGALRLDFGLPGGHLRGWRRGDQAWTELPVPADLTGESGGNPSILDLPTMTPFTNLEVADRLFVDAVLDGRPAEPTLLDGWRACRVIDAVVISDSEHRWVSADS